MIILGISALYHDAAAAIVRDGEIIAAAQEERFTRKKHDLSFPVNAIKYCLDYSGIEIKDVDHVVYYDDPILTLDRFVKNALSLGEDATGLIDKSSDDLFGKKLWIHESIRRVFGTVGKRDKLLICEHHLSHAASAFFPSPFEEAAIITIDGVGEWATTTIGYGKQNNIKLIKEIDYPHSIGLLYSAFTYFCGFKVNSGDYKLMGLAPYGEPKYVSLIKEKLIDIKPDGSYRLNLDYFDYYRNDVMTNEKFADLFGGDRRTPESPITKREMDMAASVQKVIEEVLYLIACYAYEITGAKKLVMAGGVALNCVANGKLLRKGPFDDIWIQPAAGDAGGAVGSALYAYFQYEGNNRIVKDGDMQKGSYLGPSFSDDEIEAYLKENNYPYHKYDSIEEKNKTLAGLLKEEKVVGICSGRMEYGPRALGNRSIIGDPRSEKMQSVMNLKIKYRESFRPFAPVVLEEDADEYFELNGKKSPYMLICADVVEERRKPFDISDFWGESDIDMLPIVNVPRSDIPAVTHVDYSARVQTTTASEDSNIYGILKSFKEATGCAVLINTSFNVRGEPIVCTYKDAYLCFMRTEMDVLVLGNLVLLKDEQPEMENSDDWREQYELD